MKVRKLVLAALFIAFSFIGGNIKIMGTVAFDSMPAFLGSLILGPGYGAVIGALGHFLDAATSGFPLTLPVHIIIMVCMAVVMYIFSKLQFFLEQRTNFILASLVASVVAILLNGPVECFLLLPILGMGVVIGTIPVLTLAALANVILAQFLYRALPQYVKVYSREMNH